MNAPQRKDDYTCPNCSTLARRVEELEDDLRAILPLAGWVARMHRQSLMWHPGMVEAMKALPDRLRKRLEGE